MIVRRRVTASLSTERWYYESSCVFAANRHPFCQVLYELEPVVREYVLERSVVIEVAVYIDNTRELAALLESGKI